VKHPVKCSFCNWADDGSLRRKRCPLCHHGLVEVTQEEYERYLNALNQGWAQMGPP
jgi:hypothetical protein